MKLSKVLTKTLKETPADEISKNAQLLIKAGFVDKLTAGVYTYLPFGKKVIDNISSIVREEMNAINGQEISMPTLQPKQLWETTKRWDKVDILFTLKSRWGSWEYAVGPSHEEVVVPLAKKFIQSYKDLPIAIYQIGRKFRDEARAKSGLLRGREFLMKDLYSFHANEEDFKKYYQKSIDAYKKVFQRCGFDNVLVTEASGGDFSERMSHEFQVITNAGEDFTLYCDDCDYAVNKEIAKVKIGDACPKCNSGKINEAKTSEVGNIFDLGSKYTDNFEVFYTDEKGEKKIVVMGCYGIGITRLMGAIVEEHADDKGLIWPESVAPFKVHIAALGDDENVLRKAENLYKKFMDMKIEVLLDDRSISNGEKLADADLIGIPHRVVVSLKSGDLYEYKARNSNEIQMMDEIDLLNLIS